MEKTVAAISTAPGIGGIAVIRMSGNRACEIADTIFFGKKKLSDVPTHTVHYGAIKNSGGEKLDEVLVTVMRAPHTFTGEDVVEISTHGGVVAPREVLNALIHAGAYPAGAGEFTKRAFLNGKLDLSQAEAVIDIINSTNELSQRNALSQLEGSLSKEIRKIRDRLVHLLAQMQVIIDYPDEDLEDVTISDIREISVSCKKDVEVLLKTADNGKILRDGIKTVIVGKPNVGKSSILNSMARRERAIVTDIAGTTRDIIEEYVSVSGIPLILTDTAGIRETENPVEKIGVEKSRQSIEEADLIIAVIDGSGLLDDEDREVLAATRDKKRIILINKTDLGHSKYKEAVIAKAAESPVLEVSALTGDGFNLLADEIKNMYNLGDITRSGAVITNLRHKAALNEAALALGRAVNAVDSGMPSDIVSIDLSIAVDNLGEITGESVSELVVSEIFHRFCVGK